MSFIKDLIDSITGEAKRDSAEQIAADKLHAAEDMIDMQKALDALKLSPERMKQIKQMVIGISIVIGFIVVFLVIKFHK